MAAWEGQGTNARLIGKLKSETGYTFLLLDAVELVALCVKLLDLAPDLLLRELHKAYALFGSTHLRHCSDYCAAAGPLAVILLSKRSSWQWQVHSLGRHAVPCDLGADRPLQMISVLPV